MDDAIRKRIEADIKNNKVMLYMKGTPDFPQCGFSAQVISIMKECGAAFHSCDVLEDDNIRGGIKEFSDWPTVPQLYVEGKFIGGCDIVTEMHSQGDLLKILTQDK